MSPLRESIKQIARKMQRCEQWLELVRDLREPIPLRPPPEGLHMRWAEKRDLFEINALEGFVKETNFLEAALAKGDRCLLLELPERILAFAWVTFTDYKLALWYTLNLPPGWVYLVYIFVHSLIARRGVGSHLLGALMEALRDQGATHLVSGMYSNWDVSFHLHTRMGFRVHRRLTQCKLLHIFPVPPKVD